MQLSLQLPCFLHFFFLLVRLTFSLSKPGCPTHCGNSEIPYPFGIGSNCSINNFFEVHCNSSTDRPKPYLLAGSGNYLEVVEFSGSQIRVKYPNLAVACYDLSDPGNRSSTFNVTEQSDFNIDFSYTPYTLSEDNWVTAVGCDDFVTVQGGDTVGGFAGGCLSVCRDRGDSGPKGSCPDNGNGYSPGYGCCRSPIPRGTTFLGVYSSDIHWNWGNTKLFPCSYAFVGEMGNGSQSGFSYRLDDLHNSTAFLNNSPTATSTPLVLDWRIGTDNCSLEKRVNSSRPACQENSSCVDANAGGYLCRCSDGYEGNPYLVGGCQDIDECKSDSHKCGWGCVNRPGTYNCICPQGYYGDGKRNGFGCHRLPGSKVINNVSIGLGFGIGSLLLLLICFWLHKLFRKRANKKEKQKFFKRNGGLLLQQQTNKGTIGATKIFAAKELDKATDHFNESRILGQGGQGTVYKGMLSTGQMVAVKKSKRVDENELEQFINEVVILSQINHRNVVKLLGCCLETEVPLLVYEFMPNGTLFDLIHDPNTEFPVTWNMRLKIVADVAGALAYLHSASSLPIYHRDIKSSNILLDEKYVVKVSDFGTSRSVAVDQTHLTTLVKGTFGYLDPEYFQSSQFTEKSDVYSFGVVLVELLTGKRPISSQRTEEERSLVTRFIASMEKDCLDEILDEQVSGDGKKGEVVSVARLAQTCLNLKGKMRPTMKEVATELESVRMSRMSRAATSSVVEDGFQEVRFDKAKMMMLEYSWTTSGNTVASSLSDSHPLMSEPVRYLN